MSKSIAAIVALALCCATLAIGQPTTPGVGGGGGGTNLLTLPSDTSPPAGISVIINNGTSASEQVPLANFAPLIAAYLNPLTAASGPAAGMIAQRSTRTGGAFSKGIGTVSFSVTSTSAGGMQYRLYDANSTGATATAGTGTALTSWTAASGVTLTAGVNSSVAVTLPASNSDYYMDVAPAGGVASPVRVSAKFAVGELVAVAGQSLAADFINPANNDTGTTLASLSLSPSGASRIFAGYNSTTGGNWLTPADSTIYYSAGAVEFGNRLAALTGVRVGIIGFATGGVSITAFQSGSVAAALATNLTAAGGKFGTLYFIQGHADAGVLSTATYLADLTSFLSGLQTSYGSFNTVLASIPSMQGSAFPTAGVDLIRAADLQYVAAHPTTSQYVAGLDETQNGGVHPIQAGQQIAGRHVYRAAANLMGLLPYGDTGPAVASGARTTGSAVIKLTITQAGGTALTTAGTGTGLAAQFAVYQSGTTTSPLTVSSVTVASATEVDITLSAAPADSVALDVWYRPVPDATATIAAGIYDNVTDTSDAGLGGRQLAFYHGALLIAAPGGTPPGAVQSLAAGSPTSTTIPVTYTAPLTGTTPYTYAGYTAPHGTTTWTLNGATCTATGCTLSGLTASTNYDVEVIASGPGGAGTPATVTTGITTTSGGRTLPVVGSGGGTAPTIWFDASNSSTLFSDAAGTTLATGTGTVQRINDAAGSGRYFSQATSGNAPTLTTSNSHPAINFTGGTQIITASGSYVNTLGSAFTKLVVFRTTALYGVPAAIYNASSAAGGYSYGEGMLVQNTGVIEVYFDGAGGGNNTQGTVAHGNGTLVKAVIRWDGTNLTIRTATGSNENGTGSIGAPGTLTSPFDTIGLGAWGPHFPYNGVMYEEATWPVVATDTQADALLTYAAYWN